MLLSDRLSGLDFHGKVIERINGGYYYECTHLRTLITLRRICRDAGNEDSILDVGCGKGHMLRFFAGFDFRQADGIEKNPKLVLTADQNIKKLELSSRVFPMDSRDFSGWEDYTWFNFLQSVSGKGDGCVPAEND